jgi:PAS domain S-box-containing protein
MAMPAISTLILQTSPSTALWTVAAVVFIVVLVAFVFVIAVAARRYLHRGQIHPNDEFAAASTRVDDPTAFMTASMQAVIQRLREQEKELESLHRREKERAQETERLSEAVTRNMPAGLLIINAAGIVTSANPAAETALGFRSLPYRRYTELFGADSPLGRLLSGCLQRSETYRREELEHVIPSGEVRQLGVTISPILSKDGKVSGALCLLSDLTELKVLQHQMQLKENLASLGELSAGIAHEFKNALATISGYAQMIRSEAKDGDAAENAGRIVEQTRALTHVVTEFLKFARPLDLVDEQVTVRELVENVAEEVRHGIPDVVVAVEGDFADVTGDESLLRQALLNLTRNAAEAVAGQSARGQVVLRGAIERAPGGEYQRVTVHDNGPGIPPEDLPKLFLPFYTTKAAGTGLGLAIVQKIVLQHGGRVEARNGPDGGAEFILWLPLRTPAVRTVDSASAGI